MRYSSHLLVRVQPSLSARLAAAAKAQGTTMSDLTRRAVEREIADAARKAQPEARS